MLYSYEVNIHQKTLTVLFNTKKMILFNTKKSFEILISLVNVFNKDSFCGMEKVNIGVITVYLYFYWQSQTASSGIVQGIEFGLVDVTQQGLYIIREIRMCSFWATQQLFIVVSLNIEII